MLGISQLMTNQDVGIMDEPICELHNDGEEDTAHAMTWIMLRPARAAWVLGQSSPATNLGGIIQGGRYEKKVTRRRPRWPRRADVKALSALSPADEARVTL
jgi:hypothetical protein